MFSEPGRELWARLASVHPVMLSVIRRDRQVQSFRVLLPMVVEPSLGNELPSSLSEFAEVLGDGNPDFATVQLRFKESGKPAYEPNCEAEFFRPIH